MSMNITTEGYLTLLFGLFYQLWIYSKVYHLGIINWRMGFFWGLNPLAIEISPWKVATIVPYNNTIDVQHRNNFEHKVLSQHSCSWTITQQKVNNVLNNITWHCFSGMHTSSQNYRSFILVWSLSNSQIVTTKIV